MIAKKTLGLMIVLIFISIQFCENSPFNTDFDLLDADDIQDDGNDTYDLVFGDNESNEEDLDDEDGNNLQLAEDNDDLENDEDSSKDDDSDRNSNVQETESNQNEKPAEEDPKNDNDEDEDDESLLDLFNFFKRR